MKTRVLWGFLEKPDLRFFKFQKNPEPEIIKKINSNNWQTLVQTRSTWLGIFKYPPVLGYSHIQLWLFWTACCDSYFGFNIRDVGDQKFTLGSTSTTHYLQMFAWYNIHKSSTYLQQPENQLSTKMWSIFSQKEIKP
jgi:hypothetical protein